MTKSSACTWRSLSVLLVTLAIFVGNAVASPLNSPLCRQNKNESLLGVCIPYPPQGVCGGVLAGKSVYLAVGQNLTSQEVFAITIMATLRANRGLVDDECLKVGDAYACSSVYPGCVNADPSAPPFSEGVPILPCESLCRDLWDKCSVPFNQFNIGTIQQGSFDVKDFSFPHCPSGEVGVGTFEIGPQPTDFFGDRFIRALGAYPIGYTGQRRNPPSSAFYTLQNSTVVDVPCLVPDIPATFADITPFLPQQEIVCPFPLKSNGEKCVIPCPFPVIPEDQQDQIGLAFVVPAFFGLFFCIFVLVDSLFVIAESQGFNRLLKFRVRFLQPGSTADGSASGTGVGGTSGNKRRRNQLRAATLYSLLGALLGIVFFFTGPMITLIRKQNVSCGLDPVTIDLGDVARGTGDLSDDFCRAQRITPFLLQMIFNLILYAIVRVFLVVTETSRGWDDTRKRVFDVLLISYCAGIPILFMIVAMDKDNLSNNVVDFITQFSRNSAICVPRLTVADEVVLIFLPFIITGILITWLSLYIYMHLSQITKGVTGLSNQEAKKNSTSTALRLLMTRLSFLGIATFLVLIIFISASASLMQTMADFAPKFNAFFGCQAAKASQCKTCEGETALMLNALPSSVAFAAQIAAMSSISLLFGGFFAAQSFARLYKEYQDGTLQIKLGNLWHGRPIGFRPGMLESSMHSFSAMGDKMAETKEAVKESCLSIWYGKYQRWRQSQNGRARGPVFRWIKRKTGPRKKFDFVPRSWNSKKTTQASSDVKWQGVVGGMHTYSRTEDSSDLTNSSAAWKTSMSHTNNARYTESWVSPPTAGVSSWNNGFQPASYEDQGQVEASRGKTPVFPVLDDEGDGEPRRPPSRCPSI